MFDEFGFDLSLGSSWPKYLQEGRHWFTIADLSQTEEQVDHRLYFGEGLGDILFERKSTLTDMLILAIFPFCDLSIHWVLKFLLGLFIDFVPEVAIKILLFWLVFLPHYVQLVRYVNFSFFLLLEKVDKLWQEVFGFVHVLQVGFDVLRFD